MPDVSTVKHKGYIIKNLSLLTLLFQYPQIVSRIYGIHHIPETLCCLQLISL